MSQEATIICVDNSEFTRNGDFLPTRHMAQVDAATILFNSKLNQNPENMVGAITLAGDRVELRTGLTKESGLLYSALHGVKVGGKSEFLRGITTAQLALKHRPSKNQQQRIVAFVASPVEADVKALDLLGRTLKKNSVFIDIISLGEIDENREKLEKLISSAGGGDKCRYLEVPAGATLTDILVSSPISQGEYGTVAGFGGVGMDDDPELAAAIAASLAEFGGGAPAVNVTPAAPAPAAAAAAAPVVAAPAPAASSALIEGLEGIDPIADPELYMALRLSLEESANAAAAAAESGSGAHAAAEDILKDEETKREDEEKKD